MSDLMEKLHERLGQAVRHFWTAREGQAGRQGGRAAKAKDRGQRRAVTGGKQMDGFTLLARDLLTEAGVHSATIFCKTRTEIPGWFRPEKDWDLL
jgi:Restriction endonuclease XhoI